MFYTFSCFFGMWKNSAFRTLAADFYMEIYF